jgi:hypothetical protein
MQTYCRVFYRRKENLYHCVPESEWLHKRHQGLQTMIGRGSRCPSPYDASVSVCGLGSVWVHSLLVFTPPPFYLASSSSFCSSRGNYSGRGKIGITNVVIVPKSLLICSHTGWANDGCGWPGCGRGWWWAQSGQLALSCWLRVSGHRRWPGQAPEWVCD